MAKAIKELGLLLVTVLGSTAAVWLTLIALGIGKIQGAIRQAVA